MNIIETVTEWETVTDGLVNQDILVIPIFSDHKTHPAMNQACVFGVFCGQESFLIACNHNEVANLDIELLSRLRVCQRVWTPDKKRLLHAVNLDNIYDAGSLEYLETGSVTANDKFFTPVHKMMYESLEKQRNLNKAVPIMQHIAYFDSVFAHFSQVVKNYQHFVTEPQYKFLNDIAIPCLWHLERTGIHVDVEKLVAKYNIRVKRYIDNTDRVYTEYNPYTTTGRTSNRFGNINFAALNKKDGTREIFTSRFDDGLMVMMDFESFHLRLIADIIGYEFPSDQPVHEYLGQQYFGKSELTAEEYDEGKAITFALLYGESRDNNIPEFFKRVYDYVDMLGVLIHTNGYVMSPYFKRKIYKEHIEDPTPSKIFNYIIQLAETERNLKIMLEMMKLFENKQSVPTLYTYDSILFDYSMSDGTELIKDILSVLTENGKYPMRVYYGATYHDMKRLDI